MTSLRARLLVVASLVVAVFVILSGAGLEQAFRSSAEQVQHDKMQGLVYALLGAAEAGESGLLTIPTSALPDPRLARVQSSLEALIFNDKGSVVWRSPNFSGAVPQLQAPAIGDSIFRVIDERFALTYGVNWAAENLPGHGATPKPKRYTVAVLEDSTAFNDQLKAFRRTLLLGLGGSALALIVVQFFVLRWGLQPLGRLVSELSSIESGEKSRLDSGYPDELRPLANGLNAMITAERTQQTRYRDALGDLAHSLKTPLAVLRGVVETVPLEAGVREQFEEPLLRIQGIADYQLKRASSVGRRTLSEPIAPRPIVDKTIAALSKVYADKGIAFANEVPPRLRLRADEGDLYELFGNLLDNAAKWCRRRIRIRAAIAQRELRIDIEDDGPGFPPDAENLLRRGVRADSLTPGQGIGLATVSDLVALNEGRIELGTSEMGGARLVVIWPV